eukprot:5791628-Heterocapsa_arctica.AAC.1
MRGRFGLDVRRAFAEAVGDLHRQSVPPDRVDRPAVQQAAHARRHRGQRKRTDSILPSSPLHSLAQEFRGGRAGTGQNRARN